MANDIYGTLTPTDLTGFAQSVQASDPYGIAGQALGAFQPDMSTWSAGTQGATAFGKAFLSSILGNYARQNTANQLSSVVQSLPSLTSNPYGTAVPEGVDSSAYNILRGTSALNQAQMQAASASKKSDTRMDLLKTIFGEGVKTGAMSPQAALEGIETGKLPFGQEVDASKNPNSPQYKMQKDLDDKTINLRKEFNALDPVKNFAKASQAANALAGALKDNSKVSDQELVRYSILMIEPGMAVREGEQGAVANSQSIPEAFRGQMLGALSGNTVLGPDVREGIKNLASRAYNSHKGLYEQANELYSKEATLQGIDPSRISYIGAAPDASSIFSAPKVQVPIETKAQIQSEYLALKSRIGADAAKAQIAAKYPELR